jgi:hypothetical protein
MRRHLTSRSRRRGRQSTSLHLETQTRLKVASRPRPRFILGPLQCLPIQQYRAAIHMDIYCRSSGHSSWQWSFPDCLRRTVILRGRSKTLKEMARHHGHGSSAKPIDVAGGHLEPDHHQSVFSQLPQSPHGAYPQAFGNPLPAYASPAMSINRMPSQM